MTIKDIMAVKQVSREEKPQVMEAIEENLSSEGSSLQSLPGMKRYWAKQR